jgi:hypothetical protein
MNSIEKIINNLGENYYLFNVWDDKQEGESESFYMYGNAFELIGMLDSIIETVERCVIIIEHEGVELLRLDHPTGPDDYEVLDSAKRHAIEGLIKDGTSYWNKDTHEIIFYQKHYDDQDYNWNDEPTFTIGRACWDEEWGLIAGPTLFDDEIARKDASLRIVTEDGWLSKLNPETYESGPKVLEDYDSAFNSAFNNR